MYREGIIKKFNLKITAKDVEPGALFIIKALNDSSYKAVIVGGCIRNLVMREKPFDWDIATEATVEEIAEVFKDYKVVTVGKRYGTVAVVINQINYQVTTFRGEKKDNGSGQLDKLSLDFNLLEDIKRRDFTINALAWTEEKGVIDYFNGIADIQQKVIRGVDNPRERFKEDPLRMLRAIRLACELDFKIEDYTLEAICNNNILIQTVSLERIRDEVIKILTSNYPERGIRLLHQVSLLGFILPELERCAELYHENFYPGKNLLEHIANLLDNLPPVLVLRLVALLGKVAQTFSGGNASRIEVINEILRRLKFKKIVVKQVNILAQVDWPVIDFQDKKSIRRLISRVGKENVLNILELKKADVGRNEKTSHLNNIKKINQKIKEVFNEGPPVSIKDLAVNGADLINFGYKEGKELGDALKKLLEIVIERPELNKKENLLEILELENSD